MKMLDWIRSLISSPTDKLKIQPRHNLVSSETEQASGMPILSDQEEWRSRTLAYVDAFNKFIKNGFDTDWEDSGDPPEQPDLKHLAIAAINAVRQASIIGDWTNLRDLWPPAFSPLIGILEDSKQSIPVVCILPDSSIVARIGSQFDAGKTVHIIGDSVVEEPEVGFFGRCPNRRYFATAKPSGVQITDGWKGIEVALCKWPTGLENLPDGFAVKPLTSPPTPTRLIPFPDGTQTLLVCNVGIFVLSPTAVQRLLPTREDLEKEFTWLQEAHPNDELTIELSMEHGAVSKDGSMIAVGYQSSSHLVFDGNLNLVGDVGNLSEYPHYALFSSDGGIIAFNSCHFYNGVTVGLPINLLPDLKTDPYKTDSRTPVLEEETRTYAGVSRNDEFIVGDAHGYVRAFSIAGDARWFHHIGGTICDMDISEDGKTLVVSTCAGFISIIRLDVGMQAPYQIGNGNHLETRRWIFWKNEPKPLIW